MLNGHIFVNTQKHIKQLYFYLKSTECNILNIEESLAKISNPMIMTSFKRFKVKSTEILKTFRLEMSQKEYNRVNQLLNSCAIPTSKLLVKKNKLLKELDKYCYQLIVLIESFISKLSKLGYIMIRDSLPETKS